MRGGIPTGRSEKGEGTTERCLLLKRKAGQMGSRSWDSTTPTWGRWPGCQPHGPCEVRTGEAIPNTGEALFPGKLFLVLLGDDGDTIMQSKKKSGSGPVNQPGVN